MSKYLLKPEFRTKFQRSTIFLSPVISRWNCRSVCSLAQQFAKMTGCLSTELSRCREFVNEISSLITLVRLPVISWTYYLLCFSLKRLWIFFVPYTYTSVKLVIVVWRYRQLSLRLLFRDIMRMIFHIDFKCGSINFHKQEATRKISDS